MASIYDINIPHNIELLIHPDRRKRKVKDYLNAITYPLTYLVKYLFEDYRKGLRAGIDAEYYDNSTTYYKDELIIFTDDSVYECLETSSSVPPVGHASSSTKWRKYLKSYIGAEERQRYNGQLIMLCYMINKKFRITSGDLIYFTHTTSFGSVLFNVYVPLAVYNALGATNTDRDNVILGYLEKYVPAGVIEYTTVNSY